MFAVVGLEAGKGQGGRGIVGIGAVEVRAAVYAAKPLAYMSGHLFQVFDI